MNNIQRASLALSIIGFALVGMSIFLPISGIMSTVFLLLSLAVTHQSYLASWNDNKEAADERERLLLHVSEMVKKQEAALLSLKQENVPLYNRVDALTIRLDSIESKESFTR